MRILGDHGAGGDDVGRLRARVNEAAHWAERHFDAADAVGSLRQLAPASSAPHVISDDLGECVGQVADARAEALGPVFGPRPHGRILALDVHETLSDGAAEEESNGFFDVENVPPSDTWVALVRIDDYGRRTGGVPNPLLLAWVPGAALHWMERAFYVNPEECLRWLDDLYPDLVRALG